MSYPDLYEASVEELQSGLNAGHFSSVDLVKAYLARIDEVNLKGPCLRAVFETNANALATAAELDAERKAKGSRGALHGIPVLLKDNVATIASEGMNTTAGSYCLQHSVVPSDAGIVKRLRSSGAIILGKASLSEWANYRGDDIPSGWSGVGGQTTGAYYPNADPSGSSSGSGVAASIGLAAVTIGTETDGSIMFPSSYNNIVGIKPTVGLTSRAGVVPLSSHQDTVGPMTRCVSDAAVLLSIIAGKDLDDSATLTQPDPVPDFTKALRADALRGKRIGVPRRVFLDVDDNGRGDRKEIIAAFEKALDVIRELGATVVDPADLPSAEEIKTSESVTFIMDTDFKVDLEKYISNLISNPSGVRNMADVIKFNDDHPELEKPEGFEDQSILKRSEATPGRDAAFFESLALNHDLGATRGIDAALQKHNLDALVLPSDGLTPTPAGTGTSSAVNCPTETPIAIVGYPLISVPLGFFSSSTPVHPVHPGKSKKPRNPQTVYPAPGLPFGISFIGTAWSDYELVGYAYAFEQKTKTRTRRRAYEEAVPRTQLRDVMNDLITPPPASSS